MKLLVTGGAGFIGSNFVSLACARHPAWRLTVLDKLTYSGNRANLGDAECTGRVDFVQGDICDRNVVNDLVPGHDAVLNFAAETHVDRSIIDSHDFVRTDVEGTRTLLEAIRRSPSNRYLQISTDEVYGDIPAPVRADEQASLSPRSPYSASKAAGDLMVSAYHSTFGLDAMITRASNNFGPYQFPEKLIPLFLTNAFQGLPLPVYGDGAQERDWIYVTDHCEALLTVLARGSAGEVYNVGTEVERTNLMVVNDILRLTGASAGSVVHVEDRPGHDRRYAMRSAKIRELGWAPAHDWERGLAETVDWYRSNPTWWRECRNDEFESYYRRQYGDRLGAATA